MRIRNRSCSAVLASRGSCERAVNVRTFTDEVKEMEMEVEVEVEEEKFLLPLVTAAAMDAQLPEDDDQVDGVGALTITGTGTGFVGRRAHKWRDILLRHSAGNAESCEAIKVDSWEGGKTKFKGNKIMRNKGDKIGFLENEVGHLGSKFARKGRGLLENENTSNSFCDEAGIASDYGEYGSSKSGGFENDFMSRKHEQKIQHFGEREDECIITIKKRRRTKKNRESVNAWRSGDIYRFIISEEEEGINMKKDKPKALEKPMQAACNNNIQNSHVGSQCRRRNGRGWRCSQRTLVGYSLCEHHLGKGRLKSINTTTGTVFLNNNKKGSKFKELRLLDDSSSAKVENTIIDALSVSEGNMSVVIREL